mmetsp:Transcript_26747/g.57633  ORF Transcript_26747/g.57633 Transcript_26747/m.57633 type:complete len:232 (-) Transcript_26747:121-816(-)
MLVECVVVPVPVRARTVLLLFDGAFHLVVSHAGDEHSVRFPACQGGSQPPQPRANIVVPPVSAKSFQRFRSELRFRVGVRVDSRIGRFGCCRCGCRGRGRCRCRGRGWCCDRCRCLGHGPRWCHRHIQPQNLAQWPAFFPPAIGNQMPPFGFRQERENAVVRFRGSCCGCGVCRCYSSSSSSNASVAVVARSKSRSGRSSCGSRCAIVVVVVVVASPSRSYFPLPLPNRLR